MLDIIQKSIAGVALVSTVIGIGVTSQQAYRLDSNRRKREAEARLNGNIDTITGSTINNNIINISSSNSDVSSSSSSLNSSDGKDINQNATGSSSTKGNSS